MATIPSSPRTRPIRALSRVVVGAGLLGLVATLAFALVALPGLARVDATLDRSAAAIQAAAGATRSAADAFDGFDASFEEATQAAADASAIAARSAATARGLAATMGLSVFGAQPLLPLAGGFESSATDLDALSGTLGRMGAALGGNRQDLTAVRTEIDALADELEGLADQRDLPPLFGAGIAIVVLMAAQAAGLVAAGLAISRLDARSGAAAAGR